MCRNVRYLNLLLWGRLFVDRIGSHHHFESAFISCFSWLNIEISKSERVQWILRNCTESNSFTPLVLLKRCSRLVLVKWFCHVFEDGVMATLCLLWICILIPTYISITIYIYIYTQYIHVCVHLQSCSTYIGSMIILYIYDQEYEFQTLNV